MISIPATDEEYFGWIDANESGFIVNSDKVKSDADLPMLHRSICGHVNDRNWPGYTTNKTFKLCSVSKEELTSWIVQHDARGLKFCKSCAP